MRALTQPPDPRPKTPRLKAPSGAVDSHIHLFGREADWPFHEDTQYRAAEASAQLAMAQNAALGLSHSVVVSPGGYGRDYRFLEGVLRAFPDEFRGIIVPPDDFSASEAKRLDAFGVRGVRFLAGARGAHLAPILPEVARAVHEVGWHVQFYGHAGDIVEAGPKLLDLPNTIVLDHFGAVDSALGVEQPAFETVLRMLDTGRVWVKLSGPMRCGRTNPPYAEMIPFARALVAHAPERLVWGSDWPHVNMDDRVRPNDGELLDLMLDWVPEEATRNRILADNARALYGFLP